MMYPPTTGHEVWFEGICNVPRMNYEVRDTFVNAVVGLSVAPGCVAVEKFDVPEALGGLTLPTAVRHRDMVDSPLSGERAKLRYQPHVGVVVGLGGNVGRKVPPPSRDLHLGKVVLIAYEHGTSWSDVHWGDDEPDGDITIVGRKFVRRGHVIEPMVCDWRHSILAEITRTNFSDVERCDMGAALAESLNPLGDWLLLRCDPDVRERDSGILLPDGATYHQLEATVVSVGMDVKNFWPELEPGCRVLYEGAGCRDLGEYGYDYDLTMAKPENVLAIRR